VSLVTRPKYRNACRREHGRDGQAHRCPERPDRGRAPAIAIDEREEERADPTGTQGQAGLLVVVSTPLAAPGIDTGTAARIAPNSGTITTALPAPINAIAGTRLSAVRWSYPC
jgi:hypothetical protein